MIVPNNGILSLYVLLFEFIKIGQCEEFFHFIFSSSFQGYYRGGRFVFSFKVGQNYPHEPPKVKCETMVSKYQVK